MLFLKELDTVHSILNICTLKRLKIQKFKIYFHRIYGFLKWPLKEKNFTRSTVFISDETSQRRERRRFFVDRRRALPFKR